MNNDPKEVEDLLIGGNHLASVLINRLGAGDNKFPPYSKEISEVEGKLSGDNLDLWICWRGIMRFRDYIRNREVVIK